MRDALLFRGNPSQWLHAPAAPSSPSPSSLPPAPWLGSFINQRVAAQSATDESTLRDSLHAFTGVYSLVEQNYAEQLTNDKTDKAIYDGAIPGMLHVLDPHSNFYDPKAFAQMREDQHGKYYGVGMTIQPQPDTTARAVQDRRARSV